MMKKPRENRVPVMMSEAELQAIDDWRFENRVATRSEAIRRLCQRGRLTETAVEAAVAANLLRGQFDAEKRQKLSKIAETSYSRMIDGIKDLHVFLEIPEVANLLPKARDIVALLDEFELPPRDSDAPSSE